MDDPRLSSIRALAEPLLAEQALELVELIGRPQGRQLVLRFLVDKVGGVTLQECARANQRIGSALDETRLIEDSYLIEVSSPGLDRPLASQRDFERAIGEQVRLEVRGEAGRVQTMDGLLLAVQPGALVLQTPGGNLTVAREGIQRAQKSIKW